ncbi:hypothetical protein SM021_002343 [Cronobacter muytjensii]|nr:hypothetical protein [Cronobacter muytjensii]
MKQNQMNKFIRRCIVGLSGAMALLLSSAPVLALNGRTAGDQFKMNINISGTVVATGSCTFDSASQSVESVNFGNITYSSINGFVLEGEYRQALNSHMTCTGDTAGAVMTFTSSTGKTVDFNGKKLLPVTLNGISSNNLGIEFIVNGVAKDVGAAFDVDMTTPPTIEVELLQTGASDTVSNSAILNAAASLTIAFH